MKLKYLPSWLMVNILDFTGADIFMRSSLFIYILKKKQHSQDKIVFIDFTPT
jgi:hypothetical protein